MINFSLIIPVYNRPHEFDELMLSIAKQRHDDIEIIVVEDGSTEKSEHICRDFGTYMNVKYIYQKNTGPGLARNRGAKEAQGKWLIFLDSDCIMPPGYLDIVSEAVKYVYFDCFGGPDRAHETFNTTQKAINYSMTSFLTTGGIRGGGDKFDKFYPRSFNMGILNMIFKRVDGFRDMRYGEDLDLSMRVIEQGFKTALVEEAFVYHKRRNTFGSFFKQVFHSGMARIELEKLHPKTMKLVHFLPTAFVVGNILLLLATIFCRYAALLLLVVPLTVFCDSLIKNRSLKVAIYSIAATYCQLFGYGTGFVRGIFNG